MKGRIIVSSRIVFSICFLFLSFLNLNSTTNLNEINSEGFTTYFLSSLKITYQKVFDPIFDSLRNKYNIKAESESKLIDTIFKVNGIKANQENRFYFLAFLKYALEMKAMRDYDFMTHDDVYYTSEEIAFYLKYFIDELKKK